jgi:electron transport complex, rnfABCDGE type, G subunit
MAKPSTLKNLVLTLLVITLLSAIGLGGMNFVTQEPIAKAKSQKVIEALKEVLPEFDNDPTTELKEEEVDGGTLVLYTAKKDGNWVGTAVKSFSPKGFGGRISVMFGFDTEGKISGYSVLEHSETPGLGDHMVDWFKPPVAPVKSIIERIFGFEIKPAEKNSNVYGLSPEGELRVSKDGGTIDAITAATISSRAFLDAANRAYNAYKGDAGNYSGATPSANNNK